MPACLPCFLVRLPSGRTFSDFHQRLLANWVMADRFRMPTGTRLSAFPRGRRTARFA